MCRACACMFSACALAVGVCHVSPRTGLPQPLSRAHLSVCLRVERVCVHVSLGSPESHLSHHPFPLHFLLLLFKQPTMPNCHPGSQPRIFAPNGVGRGSQVTPSISFPGMETDLEPRAKAREVFSRPRPDKDLPLWPPLPWLSWTEGKESGSPKSGSGGGGSGGATRRRPLSI